MTDTPPTDTPTPVPPSKLDTIKGVIGDLARPFSLYAIALATAKVIWSGLPADIIGAGGFVLAALYAAKTYENRSIAHADASVKIAQANSTGAPQ